ncbi:hypothetical protein LTR85_007543 [Meristemomyces frigidus]|nr:hypothetical protein LTR85_007543 [Meristemomyces frigidus]
MDLITPAALRPGATIALISPSARMNDLVSHRIERTAAFFSSRGLRTTVLYTPLPSDASLQLSIETRVDEIHRAFSDPTIPAIVCTIGGSTCNEILPHIDYDLIRSHPKIFCGYSDITLLCYAFYVKSGLRTFYGPTAITQWGEYPAPHSFTADNFFKTVMPGVGKPVGQLPCSETWIEEALDLVSPAESQRPRALKSNAGWKWLRAGRASGKLLAACLSSLLRIIGTEYDIPSYNGVILLLELPMGPNDGPVSIANAKGWISNLALHGVFKRIAGLVLGRSFGYSEEMYEKWEGYLLEVVSQTQFPILSRVDVGHTDPILTLPFGAESRMDNVNGVWEILESGVK